PIAFSPQADGVLVVGDGDGVVSVWDTTRRTLLASNTVMKAAVQALAYSGDGKRLAVGSDGEIQICDAETLRPIVSLGKHHDDQWITGLGFSPDNRMLASSSYLDRTV